MASPTSQSAASATASILVDVINSFFVAGMPHLLSRGGAGARTLTPVAGGGAGRRAHRRACGRAALSGFDDYEWRKLPQHHFIGDADAAFVDGFSPSGPREIMCAKRRYSAFFATDLALFLREQKIERVSVAGVKTNVCIRATAQDAFAHGFDVVIPKEATNSNRPHLAEASYSRTSSAISGLS